MLAAGGLAVVPTLAVAAGVPAPGLAFRTRGDAEQAAIPAESRAEGIVLLGYHASHDQGGGAYRFRADAPAHPAFFRSRDGAYWELVTDFLSFRQLGARGDGLTDDTKAVQDTLFAASAMGLKARTGAGVFVLTSDILLPVGDRCIDLEGEGWNASTLRFHGAHIRHGLHLLGDAKSYPYAGAVRNLRIAGAGGAPRGFTAQGVNHPRLERIIISNMRGCGARFDKTLMGSFSECLMIGCGSASEGQLEVDSSTTFLWHHSRVSGSNPGCFAGVLIDRSSDVTLAAGNIESAGVPIRVGSRPEARVPCEQIAVRDLDLERPTDCYLEFGRGWTGPAGSGVVGVVLENVRGTPSGASAVKCGARIRNTLGLEVRRARLGLSPGAIAAFVFEGRNSGAVIRAQRESAEAGVAWVVDNGVRRSEASPMADWRM